MRRQSALRPGGASSFLRRGSGAAGGAGRGVSFRRDDSLEQGAHVELDEVEQGDSSS
jgi:hypothetical protein